VTSQIHQLGDIGFNSIEIVARCELLTVNNSRCRESATIGSIMSVVANGYWSCFKAAPSIALRDLCPKTVKLSMSYLGAAT
jgi:hypothetical protein